MANCGVHDCTPAFKAGFNFQANKTENQVLSVNWPP